MLTAIANFITFITGVVFGILICAVALFHFLSMPKSSRDAALQLQVKTKGDEDEDEDNGLPFTQVDIEKLNSVIDHLDEVNSPLKNMGSLLHRIHLNSQEEANMIEMKMKTIVDGHSLTRMEKDHHDNVSELKDHSKQIKAMSSFLHDMGKAISSYSKDLTKLAATARSNMNKNSLMEKKEDMIVNAWWQVLQQSLDHLANDQEDLATTIQDDLQNLSLQIQEEVNMIEKRLSLEGSRHFSALRENILAFEARLREREKCKEKLRSTTASSILGDQQKRSQKLKLAEEALVFQTRRLYEVQKEFYGMLPRIASDVQLTMLKSIIETQAQLQKLADSVERAQVNSRSVTKKMKLQLTNAAASLVQMIRTESKLLPIDGGSAAAESGHANDPTAAVIIAAASDNAADTSDNITGLSSLALDIMRQRQAERGVQGYELTLQKVLEGLLLQSQLRDVTAQQPDNTASAAAAVNDSGSGSGVNLNSQGKFDMFAEATACLAAANPSLLPELPRSFNQAIGLETSVWFNAISGRVYRDMAESDYFNAWFRAKLAQMLNKGARPAYIDAFEVTQVKFGDLPPLLLNVKWMPPPAAARRSTNGSTGDGRRGSTAGNGNGNGNGNNGDEDHPATASASSSGGKANVNNNSNDSDDSDNENNSKKQPASQEGEQEDGEDDDPRYYAACNGDIISRSGIQFTVATKFWLNWPRDRYASVPVLIHLDLAELQGRVRFGVRKSHSFISFLKDPMMRISVRSEVGSDRYKLRDIPQVSELIVKKLRSFIHRKVVYPAAHKTRLIWPRNWWPKGTENMFASVPVNVNIPGQAAAVPTATVGAMSEGSLTVKSEASVQTDNTIATTNANTAITPTRASRSKSISQSQNDSSSAADAVKKTTPRSAEKDKDKDKDMTQVMTTTSAAPSTAAIRPSLSQENSINSTNNVSSISKAMTAAMMKAQGYEDYWQSHLRAIINSGSVSSSSLDDRAVIVHFREFYRKQLEGSSQYPYYVDNDDQEQDQGDEPEQTQQGLQQSGKEEQGQGQGQGQQLQRGNISTFYTLYTRPNLRRNNNNNTACRSRVRAMSISDYRSEVLEAVLEDVLSNQADVQSSFAINATALAEAEELAVGKLLVGFGGVATPDKINKKQQSLSPEQLEEQQKRRAQRRRATQQQHQRQQQQGSAGTEGEEEDNTYSLLKSKGLEQMEKAKAKFRAFKSKHFGEKDGAAVQGQGQGQGQQPSQPRKLKDYFFSEESGSNDNSGNNHGGGGGGSHSKLERRMSWTDGSTNRSRDREKSLDDETSPMRMRRNMLASDDSSGPAGLANVKTSTTLKYVASMFRGNSDNAATGGGRESSMHGASLHGHNPGGSSSHGHSFTNSSSPSHSGTIARPPAASGGQAVEKESSVSSMFSKALSTVRQQINDRDTA